MSCAGEGRSEQGRAAVLALLQAMGQGLGALSMYRCQVCFWIGMACMHLLGAGFL